MLTTSLLPPRHEAQPFMRLPFAFVRDFREYAVSRDHADALTFDRCREAQALDDAEFVPVPEGYTACLVCRMTVENAARLACSVCAS